MELIVKKRLVAVTLGVILSLSTVGEAGASVFSSPEDTAASQDEIAGSEAAEQRQTVQKQQTHRKYSQRILVQRICFRQESMQVLQMQNHRTAFCFFIRRR